MTHALPDRENTLSLLSEWKQHHTAVGKLMDGIEEAIGLNPNGPLFDTVWKLFDAYTGTLAVEVEDFDGWLEWFSNENDMGSNGMAAGFDGKTKPIKTLEHLYSLIAESHKRMGTK